MTIVHDDQYGDYVLFFCSCCEEEYELSEESIKCPICDSKSLKAV